MRAVDLPAVASLARTAAPGSPVDGRGARAAAKGWGLSTGDTRCAACSAQRANVAGTCRLQAPYNGLSAVGGPCYWLMTCGQYESKYAVKRLPY